MRACMHACVRRPRTATNLGISMDARRLRRLGVSSKVGAEDTKASANERGQLPAPTEPEVREAMEQANRWRVCADAARLYHVQLDTLVDGDVVVRQGDATDLVELGQLCRPELPRPPRRGGETLPPGRERVASRQGTARQGRARRGRAGRGARQRKGTTLLHRPRDQ